MQLELLKNLTPRENFAEIEGRGSGETNLLYPTFCRPFLLSSSFPSLRGSYSARSWGIFHTWGRMGRVTEEGFRPYLQGHLSLVPTLWRGVGEGGSHIWPLPCILSLENTQLYPVPFRASILIKEAGDKFGLGSHQASEVRAKTVFIGIISRKINLQDLSLERNLSGLTKSDMKTSWLPSKATGT